MTGSVGSGEWLQQALLELCSKIEKGLQLDEDVISGLVSYCEMASPLDAREYLCNIVGEEVGRSVIEEYLQRRGYTSSNSLNPNAQSSKMHAYMKPSSDVDLNNGTKRTTRAPKERTLFYDQDTKNAKHKDTKIQLQPDSKCVSKENSGVSRKKKSGKVISLAEATKGSIVFQKGKPCSCQARRHKLVSNCLSCGKIVCEQEGEGPCNFCGALVLKEGSTYAGLDEVAVPLSDSEAAAEAFAKRLVEYDRNSSARTSVIDDQNDYYEIDGNSWLSMEEKELLRKKQLDIEEAERVQRSKVIVTLDLFGRKVLLNEDDASELESESRILRPPSERELNRIKPNPGVKVQPAFMDPGRSRNPTNEKQNSTMSDGIRLDITGRVQHDFKELQYMMADDDFGRKETSTAGRLWQGPSMTSGTIATATDEKECFLDYR